MNNRKKPIKNFTDYIKALSKVETLQELRDITIEYTVNICKVYLFYIIYFVAVISIILYNIRNITVIIPDNLSTWLYPKTAEEAYALYTVFAAAGFLMTCYTMLISIIYCVRRLAVELGALSGWELKTCLDFDIGTRRMGIYDRHLIYSAILGIIAIYFAITFRGIA